MPQIGAMYLEPPIFTKYITPHGVFPKGTEDNIGIHGLWYYYISALEIFKFKIDGWQYEDEPNKEDTFNLQQLFTSIALLYGVNPEQMTRYWGLIDKQAEILDLPTLPDSFKFNTIPEIKTQ